MVDIELAQRIVDFLNTLIPIDAKALHNLVESRVQCNSELGDHPTVQICVNSDNKNEVGLLGILNGLCGAYKDSGRGPVVGVYDTKTSKLTGFTVGHEKSY